MWAVFHLCFGFEIQDLVNHHFIFSGSQNVMKLMIYCGFKLTIRPQQLFFTLVRSKIPH